MANMISDEQARKNIAGNIVFFLAQTEHVAGRAGTPRRRDSMMISRIVNEIYMPNPATLAGSEKFSAQAWTI